MEILYKALVVLHLVGMAILVGGWLVTVRMPRVLPAMWHGALTQLVTGLALVGLASSGVVDAEVDNVKIAVKLVVALAVAGLVMTARNKQDVAPRVAHAVGGLALLNVLVAVFWS